MKKRRTNIGAPLSFFVLTHQAAGKVAVTVMSVVMLHP